jgi:hypothetical protein
LLAATSSIAFVIFLVLPTDPSRMSPGEMAIS